MVKFVPQIFRRTADCIVDLRRNTVCVPVLVYTFCLGILGWTFNIHNNTGYYVNNSKIGDIWPTTNFEDRSLLYQGYGTNSSATTQSTWEFRKEEPKKPEDTFMETHDKYFLTDKARDALSIYGREDLLDTNRNCTKRLPQCIIIGVMKAGTEAFSRYLMMHPRVAMQINMPSTMFFTSNNGNGLQWYIDQMMCSNTAQITIEKAPQYYSSSLALKRIKRLLPNVKLILMVRNPIDRAVSHYLQVKSIHPELVGEKTFEEMVFNSNGQVNSKSVFINRSAYIVHIRQWSRHFPKENLLILDGDEFKENLFGPLREAENFLGLDNFVTEDKFVFDKEKGFYCIKSNSTLVENNIACLGDGKGRPHPELTPENRLKLQRYFRFYNERFFLYFGRRLNW